MANESSTPLEAARPQASHAPHHVVTYKALGPAGRTDSVEFMGPYKGEGTCAGAHPSYDVSYSKQMPRGPLPEAGWGLWDLCLRPFWASGTSGTSA